MLIVTYIIYCNITTGVHIPLVHSENWQVCHFVPSAYKIVKTMYTSMNISALSNVLAMRVRPRLKLSASLTPSHPNSILSSEVV